MSVVWTKSGKIRLKLAERQVNEPEIEKWSQGDFQGTDLQMGEVQNVIQDLSGIAKRYAEIRREERGQEED